MAHLETVPPEELPEVVRVAVALHAKETAGAQEKQCTVAAASEVGIPPEYLERAAAQIAGERRTRRKRRLIRWATICTALAALLGAGGAWRAAHPAFVPVTYTFDDPSQAYWTAEHNGGTQEAVSFQVVPGGHGSSAVVSVKGFGFGYSPGVFDEQFTADLATLQAPASLKGYQTVSFRVKGAGLGQIRLFLEHGQERWVSPFLPAAGAWHTCTVPLSSFLHQTNSIPSGSGIGNFRDLPYSAPNHVGRLAFKLGEQANKQDEHGTVSIDDLEFR